MNVVSGITDFPDNNNSALFKMKQKITGQTGNDGIRDFRKNSTIKTFAMFCRTLEIPLISCLINLILTLSANCFVEANAIDNEVRTFSITEAKRYVAVVTLSTQDNIKLLDQLKSGFKITISWNKYQSKATILAQN